MINPDKVNEEILMLERKDTTYATCERLAWLYIVRDHITTQQAHQPTPLDISGDSEFLQAVDGKDSAAAWAIIDELMSTLAVVNNRVYASVLAKMQAL